MSQSETMPEIWERHYDTLSEEKRLHFLGTLKKLKYQGNEDADLALECLSARWLTEKPAE
jgi:hypothetical protein